MDICYPVDNILILSLAFASASHFIQQAHS